MDIFPCGLVARIRGFHPRGTGSIPGMGISIGDSVIECWPAMRAARVHFLAGASCREKSICIQMILFSRIVLENNDH